MTVSESQENLVESGRKKSNTPMAVERNCSLAPLPEKALTPLEKRFLLYVERGDCASVRRHIAEFSGDPEKFDINCVDPLNRTALIASIENENVELLQILLDAGAETRDALLHSIKEQYVEGVEILLEHEEKIHKPNTPYSWEAVDRAQSTFTTDITPLVLAAHMNNYEIIKILLDRGATLPTPHDVRCGCDECVASSEQDSLRHSQARINAYRALSSPSLIALSSRDPLLTAFELSWELRRLSKMENEFSDEYNKMRAQVKEFATSLLDHARTSAELDTILNHDPNCISWDSEEKSKLERLKLAIDYKQKDFVAHPSVQQLLTTMWFDGLPGFRRLGPIGQIIYVFKLAASYPMNSIITKLSPNSTTAKHMNKPFVKFINHCASYLIFLSLLGAASQRVEYLLIEWFGNDWMQEMLEDWKRRERGSLPGLVETGVIMFVISLILVELDSLWDEGLLVYITNLWNIIDFVCNMFYITWIVLRFTSVFIAWREKWNGWDPHYPREEWHPFDPMLLSEGMFAAGMIFSFLKLVHIFSVNPHLGPLQISLGRMIIDIIKFFFIYTLVLFAFGCGMNKLLWYYAELEMHNCYHTPDGLPDFDENDMACTIWRRFSNLFETSQSLFWASFGMVDLMAFELSGIKSFTRFWALLMFGSYSVINVIVLLNMLIAMMSNSYQIISEHSDTEWKFARSKLWLGYFEPGDAVPPPFNMMPSFGKLFGSKPKTTNSFKMRSRDQAIERHDIVARLLVRRFVMAEQRKRDEFGITEDDVIEIRQDISTLRYELVDIFKTNGMKTPDIDKSENALAGKKGKVMERRLMQDFKIGCIDGVENMTIVSDNKGASNIFSKLAKAMGKRQSTMKNIQSAGSIKKDFDKTAVKRNSGRRDPIGSVKALERRRSSSQTASQQSVRHYIVEHEKDDVSQMDAEKLVDYNPKLRDMTPAARVAYVKFKTRKIKREMQFHDRFAEEGEQEPEVIQEGSAENKPPSRFAAGAKIAKKTTSSMKDLVTMESEKKTSQIVRERPRPEKSAASPTPAASNKDTKASEVPQNTGTSKPAEAAPTKPATKAEVSTTPPKEARLPTPAASDLKPRGSTDGGRRRSRSPSPAPPSRDGTIAEKPSAPTPAPAPTPAAPAKPKREVEKIQYSSDLEPGRGKSKVTGRMVQGWI